MSENNQQQIPILNLEQFSFSPPGPMGWSFSEYEKLLDNPDTVVQDLSNINKQIASLEGVPLVEFPLSGRVVDVVQQPILGRIVDAVQQPIDHVEYVNAETDIQQVDTNAEVIQFEKDQPKEKEKVAVSKNKEKMIKERKINPFERKQAKFYTSLYGTKRVPKYTKKELMTKLQFEEERQEIPVQKKSVKGLVKTSHPIILMESGNRKKIVQIRGNGVIFIK